MKAFTIESFGSTEGLRLGTAPTPAPGPLEAVVQVRARSLNYRDWLILRQRYLVPAHAGIIPISDGVGEVVAIGGEVTRVAIGDRVCATYFPRWRDGRMSPDMGGEQFGCTRPGMLAEFFMADEQALVKIPGFLTDEQASALPCAGVTAWQALSGPRSLVPGDTVLTIGTGGVAMFALQFAKLFGARVLSITSSEKKAEVLQSHGADEIINYVKHPQWVTQVRELTQNRGVDYVVETGGLSSLPQSLASCAAEGQLSLVAALGEGALDVTAFRTPPITIRRLYVGSRAHFENMVRAIAKHRLRPVIDRAFAFAEAREAYAYVDAKKHVGKVVITS